MTFAPDAFDLSTLHSLLAQRQHGPLALLQVLRQVQLAHGCVPDQAVDDIAQAWGISRAHIRSMVGFYHFLSHEPRGTYAIYISDSPTDRMLGSEAALAALCEALGVVEGHTRADGRVSVRRTSCTGLCDQGPAGLVNGQPITRLTPERVGQMALLIDASVPLAEWPADFFAVHNAVWRTDQMLSTPLAAGSSIQSALALGPQGVIERLAASGLRGRGGAGFATAQKWRACQQAPGPRAITCNADEGEPGTFKDRLLLTDWAQEVIEGMTVAALTVGASKGFVYLRGEYEYIAPHLHQVLAQRRTQGWLGGSVAGSGLAFDIELHLGAGAYVCGEETALIESVEGKRGIPRTRPPFPVDRGYLGLPTVNNNVETFVQAAQITLQGSDWFRARGTAASPGTRLLSVSGDVARPGLYEMPWGTRVDEVLVASGAADVQAVLVGGPSGHLIHASHGQRLLSFEDLPTGGAFTVFNHQRDLLDVARQYTHFFANESCGFCTPCRVGSGQLRSLADRLCQGQASTRDVAQVQELAQLMQQHSHCGLGQTAAHPLTDVLLHFGPQVQARLVPEAQAFDMDAACADMAIEPISEGRA